MVKEKAYAKINLFLDVLGKREDGFHNIETIMVPIDLYDSIELTVQEAPQVEVTSNIPITDVPEENLVHKVAIFMIEKFKITKGLKIHIVKRIPIAAGLAGGSADAAATLRGINKVFRLKLSNEQLAEMGELFGSDIPHCIYNKPCIARGKGEQLMFLKQTCKWPILIVTPKIQVSTKTVFQSVNMDEVINRKITKMSNAIYNRNYDLAVRELYNALEPFTFKLFPEVKALKEALDRENADGILMSGSGPSIVVFSQNKKDLQEISKKYQEKNNVILTKIN